MHYSKSIIFIFLIIAGAIILSGGVVAESANHAGLHARSWQTIDASDQGVWAISNEGALFFCRATDTTSKPVCSDPVYPE